MLFPFLFANLFVAVAIWKYELFTLTPSKAAEGIIATMTDSLVLAGPDSKIQTANHATYQLLGYQEDELLGKVVSTLFPQKAECLNALGNPINYHRQIVALPVWKQSILKPMAVLSRFLSPNPDFSTTTAIFADSYLLPEI